MKSDTQEPISGCPTQCAGLPGSWLQRHEAVDPETNNVTETGATALSHGDEEN
jgi:hypothetical protein